jgi:hypothetical protein
MAKTGGRSAGKGEAMRKGRLTARESKTTSAAYVVATDGKGGERVVKVCPDLTAARTAIYLILREREGGDGKPDPDGDSSAG